MTENYKAYLPAIKEWVESHKDEYVHDLIGAVNIKSVSPSKVLPGPYPFGEGSAQALDYALALGEKFGLNTENDDYYCGSAIFSGKTNEEIAIVGHLDVVPEGDGWDYEPYNATLVGNELVGRGASDNKGPAIAALYALRCLKEIGVSLKHTTRVLWGCHEEAGMRDMPHFLEKHQNHLPNLFLVCDCPFPIHYAEKGRLTAKLITELPSNHLADFSGGLGTSVPDYAYAKLTGLSFESIKSALAEYSVTVEEKDNFVLVYATGIAGHPAFPQNNTDNAVVKLAKALAASKLFTGKEQQILEFTATAFDGYYGENLGVASEDEISGKTTAVITKIELQNNKLIQRLNIRYSVKTNGETLINRLTETANRNGFEVEDMDNKQPLYIPLDSMNGLPLKLTELSRELLKRPDLQPVVLAGGTHASALPNAIGYGPNPGPEEMRQREYIGRAHGINESVPISDMLKAIEVYAATLIAIDDEVN